jgi:phosphoserine aminotransferase
MSRVSNFNAGPAALPLPVLEQARDELVEFKGTGMSIMEHSHRGKAYEEVHNDAIALLRELANIPAEYDVLFLQGGASAQFAMLPMNLLPAGKTADYVNSGHWAERAMEEAQFIGKIREAGSTKEEKFTRVPRADEIKVDPAAAYAHITTNNTIEGTQFHYVPDAGNVPLIADMSSDFLWKQMEVTKYAMIYAGAQKNLGPSGVTLVVIRKDLVAAGRKDIPKIFRYETHASNNSLYNTPPTFAIYLVNKVLHWIKDQGGAAAVQKTNEEKGRILYGAIDGHPDYYRCPVAQGSRSYMNVVWRLPSEPLEDQFVKEATKAGLVGLKGHRSVGGIRASTYNAVSVADVQRLADFMAEFAKKNPK